MSSAASTGISIASLEVGSATVVFLRVVAEVLIATCKVNIRKSWTGKVQGFKTISLRKLSENKTQTLPRYKSYYRSQQTSHSRIHICSVAEIRLHTRTNNSERMTTPDIDSLESWPTHTLPSSILTSTSLFQTWDSYAPMAAWWVYQTCFNSRWMAPGPSRW